MGLLFSVVLGMSGVARVTTATDTKQFTESGRKSGIEKARRIEIVPRPVHEAAAVSGGTIPFESDTRSHIATHEDLTEKARFGLTAEPATVAWLALSGFLGRKYDEGTSNHRLHPKSAAARAEIGEGK